MIFSFKHNNPQGLNFIPIDYRAMIGGKGISHGSSFMDRVNKKAFDMFGEGIKGGMLRNKSMLDSQLTLKATTAMKLNDIGVSDYDIYEEIESEIERGEIKTESELDKKIDEVEKSLKQREDDLEAQMNAPVSKRLYSKTPYSEAGLDYEKHYLKLLHEDETNEGIDNKYLSKNTKEIPELGEYWIHDIVRQDPDTNKVYITELKMYDTNLYRYDPRTDTETLVGMKDPITGDEVGSREFNNMTPSEQFKYKERVNITNKIDGFKMTLTKVEGDKYNTPYYFIKDGKIKLFNVLDKSRTPKYLIDVLDKKGKVVDTNTPISSNLKFNVYTPAGAYDAKLKNIQELLDLTPTKLKVNGKKLYTAKVKPEYLYRIPKREDYKAGIIGERKYKTKIEQFEEDRKKGLIKDFIIPKDKFIKKDLKTPLIKKKK